MHNAFFATLASALTLVCCLGLGACGDKGAPGRDGEPSGVETITTRGELRIAVEPGFKPFEVIGEDGELHGFDIDLGNILAKDLGVSIQWKRVKWESIIPTLLSGDVDLIISGMTATAERAKKVAYSKPYFHTTTHLLVSKLRAKDAKLPKDLDQTTRLITVKLGTTGDITAKELFKSATVRAFKTQNAAALEVAQGNADAFLYDLASVKDQHAKHADTTFVMRKPVSSEPYAIACRKGDPAMVAWLNRVLDALRSDGRLEAMYAKHGLEDLSD